MYYFKITYKSNNANNSIVSLAYSKHITPNMLTIAREIADKHGCGSSNNVQLKNSTNGQCHGSISFNRGNHIEAYSEFMEFLKKESLNHVK